MALFSLDTFSVGKVYYVQKVIFILTDLEKPFYITEYMNTLCAVLFIYFSLQHNIDV